MLDSRKILRTYYTDAKVKFNTNCFPLSAYRYKIFCNSRNQNDHSCIEIRGVCSTMPNIYDEFFCENRRFLANNYLRQKAAFGEANRQKMENKNFQLNFQVVLFQYNKW